MLKNVLCLSFDRSETGAPPHDIETLLRKLVEAEIDGQAAAKQVTVLRETIGKLKKVRRSIMELKSFTGLMEPKRQHKVKKQHCNRFINLITLFSITLAFFVCEGQEAVKDAF